MLYNNTVRRSKWYFLMLKWTNIHFTDAAGLRLLSVRHIKFEKLSPGNIAIK